MERPIDVDKLFEFLTEQRVKQTGMFNWMECPQPPKEVSDVTDS